MANKVRPQLPPDMAQWGRWAEERFDQIEKLAKDASVATALNNTRLTATSKLAQDAQETVANLTATQAVLGAPQWDVVDNSRSFTFSSDASGTAAFDPVYDPSITFVAPQSGALFVQFGGRVVNNVASGVGTGLASGGYVFELTGADSSEQISYVPATFDTTYSSEYVGTMGSTFFRPMSIIGSAVVSNLVPGKTYGIRTRGKYLIDIYSVSSSPFVLETVLYSQWLLITKLGL